MRNKIIAKTTDALTAFDFRKKTWVQKQEYFDLSAQLNRVVTMDYFLSIRGEIKKQVKNNYLNKSITELTNSITYDEYQQIEHNGQTIDQSDLHPLVKREVERLVKQIEDNTLSMFV